jgi:hypothetical protein
VRTSAVLGLILSVLVPVAAQGQDPNLEARRLYNAGQYEEAERVARTALEEPSSANSARVVFGRILLERYRQSAAPEHLAEGRASLRSVDPRMLDPRERIELTLGFAEALFLEDRFAAAAELFDPAVDASARLALPGHDRVLDWWATALDRYAQTRPLPERNAIYGRISRRMSEELARNIGSAPAGYWLVASARGSGDLDGAWSSAMANWVRAALAPDRGAALRGDLDRLMVQAIIPDRAARMASRDTTAVITGLLAEWESFKAGWAK